MRRILAAAISTMALAGCAGTQAGGSFFYLTPYELSELSCEELAKRESAAAARLRASEALMAKASSDPAGPLINTVVYAPDYNKARWEYDVYRGEAARKNCPPPPPPVAGTRAAPR